MAATLNLFYLLLAFLIAFSPLIAYLPPPATNDTVIKLYCYADAQSYVDQKVVKDYVILLYGYADSAYSH